MRRSLKKAKADSLAVWRYLAEHGEIALKKSLPESIFRKIEYDECFCPLCTIFDKADTCAGCPLTAGHARCSSYSAPYFRWANADLFNTTEEAEEARVKAAREIVALIEAWEV